MTAPLLARRPVVTYFVLAYLFAWAIMPLISVSPRFGLSGLFAPAAAALIVAGLTEGRAGVRRLLGTLGIWRIDPICYLVALGLPPAISAAAAVLAASRAPAFAVELAPVSPIGLLVFVLVVGEELGWRGYAQPALERGGWSPLRAAVVVGALWGVWHLPTFFLPGLPQRDIPFPAFLLFTTAYSVVAAWLVRRARGSVLIATLMHGSYNTITFLTPGLAIGSRWWMVAIGWSVVAAVVALRANAGARVAAAV
jgi:membrane protease YdiL (CAAX protease family)